MRACVRVCVCAYGNVHIMNNIMCFLKITYECFYSLVTERFLWRCCHGDGQQHWCDHEPFEDSWT